MSDYRSPNNPDGRDLWSLGYVVEGVSDILDGVLFEIRDAVCKHSFWNTPLNPEMPPEDAFIILAEEFGEVARALTRDEGNTVNLQEELLQTAAMAVAMLYAVRERANVA